MLFHKIHNISLKYQMWDSLFEEKQQMFDAYLASNVENILHISIQSNLLVGIHQIVKPRPQTLSPKTKKN